MKASLDTNVIIHLYKVNYQHILFEFFSDEVCIYEQIRAVELERHGEDVLTKVDSDISAGRIKVYTDQMLKDLSVYKMFYGKFQHNKSLYGPKDLGEVYAISLAETLGIHSLVTDDIKQGGPYLSLLQFYSDVKPFTFADILIIRYFMGETDMLETIEIFEKINKKSNLNWSLKSCIGKFRRRFFTDPYLESDTKWIQSIEKEYRINAKQKLQRLWEYL